MTGRNRRAVPSVITAAALFVSACVGQFTASRDGTGDPDEPGGAGGRGTGGSAARGGADAPPAGPPGELTDLGTGRLAELCGTPSLGRARLWRLSREQLGRTIEAALGVVPSERQLAAFADGTGLLFRNEAATLSVRKADAVSWVLSATELAAAAAPAVLKSCGDPATCGPTIVGGVGAKLFRRALRDDEKARYAKLYADRAKDGAQAATEAVLAAFLQSPYFLYRTELGAPVPGKAGVVRLLPAELASALSFTLWQSPPDAELLRAAETGELDAPAGLRKQAERLVADPKFERFYAAWLADLSRASHMRQREGADDVANGAEVMGWLDAELAAYLRAVMTDAPTLQELFTRKRLSVRGDLAQFRNLGKGSGATPVDVELPAPTAGLLGLGAVSFANAGTDHPSPVRRGLMVRENFLCAPVPAPPPDVKMELASGGDIVTNRQRYEKTTSPSGCDVCHRLFNPLGYAFEAFDELGRYRTTDNGQPVDLGGTIVGTRDVDGSFTDLADLGRKLAASQQVSECLALQGFRFASGRFETPGDLCYVNRIHDAFAKSGGNLRTLAVELVASEAFALRSTGN